MKKQCWPAPERNREVLLRVLQRLLPHPGQTLEIASGTGQHAAFFCGAMPTRKWLPSDADDGCVSSIEAWRADSDLGNFLSPLSLDVEEDAWPASDVDSVFCANMIHIAPWTSCLALLRGSGRLLGAGGLLLLYGPFREKGLPTAPSNESFDESLRHRNARWGLRDLHAVESAANRQGLFLKERIEMPANNLCVAFYKAC